MYWYEDKEYLQEDLIKVLYERALKGRPLFSAESSKSYSVLKSNGERYIFFFRFDANSELVCFTCKKEIDIKGTSLRGCWKYILEGCEKGNVKGFSNNLEVVEYLKENPNKPYRLEKKENNGTITVKCVLYDSIMDALVVDRVPYRLKKNK